VFVPESQQHYSGNDQDCSKRDVVQSQDLVQQLQWQSIVGRQRVCIRDAHYSCEKKQGQYFSHRSSHFMSRNF